MRELADDREILGYLRGDTFLHIYSIGDLDPFYRPRTRYFGFPAAGALESVFLLYSPGGGHHVLLAHGGRVEHLGALRPYLPPSFYAHASLPLLPALRGQSHGRFLKMALRSRPTAPTGRDIRRLSNVDDALAREFYSAHYPRNWFDPRMLATGQYVGGYEQGRLIGIAGVHVYSTEFRVAALGNIAVASEDRGRGWARDLTSFLCAGFEEIDHVGLNVRADNVAAIRAYEAAGFAIHAEYEELDCK
jgi:ribosomal protein S18 acetylase RimI-like enzyme